MNCPHCQTPIEEHKATRCLDAWIAEKVLGYRHGVPLPNSAGWMPPDAEVVDTGNPWTTTSTGGTYPFIVNGTLFAMRGAFGRTWSPSTSIADAWEVVTKLNSSGYIVEIMNDCIAWSVCFTNIDSDKKYTSDWKCSLQTQICRAALKAVG